ncbi:MAG: hypothetical protein NZM10_01965 [Fimbriimonadales bacterium]|nr:hypothetical protein [Fimbriimonadales bacterium]MCS7191106.1 hypothetical protein [Fimbriimonadales bacterium]
MSQEMQQAWSLIRERVKQQVTGRTLYRALDALQLVTIEGETVVLGMPHEEYQLAGHLNAPTVRKWIEQFIEEAYAIRPQLVIIEGTTLQDWQLYQRKQEELRRLSEQGVRKREYESRTYATWDAVYEQVGRKFAETPGRSLATNRARYLNEMIDFVRDALQRIPVETEADERQLNRIIERIATNVEAPSAVVAWLILHAPSRTQP